MLVLTLWKISLSLRLQAFDMHEKPWGTLVPVNGDLFRVHLACYGNVLSNSTKQPIVLFDGRQLSSAEQFQEWIQELYKMAQIGR